MKAADQAHASTKDVTQNALDRMVQLAGEALLDARPDNHQADLADSLPDHSPQLRVRVRAGGQEESTLARGVAFRHQPRYEPDLHADPIRDAKSAAGCRGHPDCLGDDPVDDGRRLAALPLGGLGPGAVFRVGVAGDGAAIEHHGDELGGNDDQREPPPAQQFIAPSSIQHGVPLNELMDRKQVLRHGWKCGLLNVRESGKVV